MNTKIVFFIFLFVFSFDLISANGVLASDYFWDDFSSANFDTKWEFMQGKGDYPGTWYIEDGSLVGDIPYEGSSYLFSRIGGTIPEFHLSLEVINIRGVDQNILFAVNNEKSHYFVANFRYNDSNWSDSNMFRLWEFNEGQFTLLEERYPHQTSPGFVLSQGEPHRIDIDFTSNMIKILFDNIEITKKGIDAISFLDNYGIGFMNWAGSYRYGNVLNKFDNVRITSISDNKFKKIVIIPGLGASWNERAMVFDEKVPDEKWAMTPFVNNYDSLITALNSQGLVRDSDYYVWNYDWRKPISEITTNFDNFLNAKVSGDDKFSLVGHSLGGLVARNWAQLNFDDERLEKVVTLGSPHYGVTKAYKAWNGGIVSDKFDFSSIALKVLMMLKKGAWKTDTAVIRSFAPVIKDLMPDFNFIKKGGVVMPLASLTEKNVFLPTANLGVENMFPKLEAVVAKGVQTEEWFNLSSRTMYDQVMGIWPDGRWQNSTFGEGDGTVLVKSAAFEGDERFDINSNHGEMVNGSIGKVFQYLGLGETEVTGLQESDWGNKQVFYLGSPVNMQVWCDGVKMENPQDGFLVVDNGYAGCRVKLSGLEEGKYHFVFGNTANEDSWNYFEDELGVGESQVLELAVKTGQLTGGSRSYLYKLVKNRLEDIPLGLGNENLKQAVLAAENENIQTLVGKFMAFRKEAGETQKSMAIIPYLEQLMVIEDKDCSLTSTKNEVLRAIRLKNYVDSVGSQKQRRRILPSEFGASSYLMMENYLAGMNRSYADGNCETAAAKADLVYRLSEQIW
jgi:pimeloyl-ACP methyl ester carboxylesterase